MLQSLEQVQDADCLDPTHSGARVVPEMRTPTRHLYPTYQHGPPPHCHGSAICFREHMAPKSGSHNLLFLEEDCSDVLAALLARGIAAKKYRFAPPPPPCGLPFGAQILMSVTCRL